VLIVIRAIKDQIYPPYATCTSVEIELFSAPLTPFAPTLAPTSAIEQSTEPIRQKARSLEDILLEFGPIDRVFYKPFQVEERKRVVTALLPPTFPTRPHPYDYFTLFFTPDLFQTITTKPDQYAAIQRIHTEQERQREWSELLIEELYVFIGTIIYIGVHEEP
jgi:hypothetical protein